MPRAIYCASCGIELFFLNKALPSQQRIVTVIEPHTCPDKDPEIPFEIKEFKPIEKKKPKHLDKLFDKFKFVKKLNDLEIEKKPSTILDVEETGDKRSTEHTRTELKTTDAPPGILGHIKNEV